MTDPKVVAKLAQECEDANRRFRAFLKVIDMEIEEFDLTFNQHPCPFLVENRCRVYEHHPETCRSYPHLHKEEFVFRLAQPVRNCSVCPITFNVYERLKAALWHRLDDLWEAEWE